MTTEREALAELEKAEAHYRLTFQIAPSPDHLDVGRAWDRMRKAGDAARAVLAQPESEQTCPACKGSGTKIYYRNDSEWSSEEGQCDRCGGTGAIAAPPPAPAQPARMSKRVASLAAAYERMSSDAENALGAAARAAFKVVGSDLRYILATQDQTP